MYFFLFLFYFYFFLFFFFLVLVLGFLFPLLYIYTVLNQYRDSVAYRARDMYGRRTLLRKFNRDARFIGDTLNPKVLQLYWFTWFPQRRETILIHSPPLTPFLSFHGCIASILPPPPYCVYTLAYSFSSPLQPQLPLLLYVPTERRDVVTLRVYRPVDDTNVDSSFTSYNLRQTLYSSTFIY